MWGDAVIKKIIKSHHTLVLMKKFQKERHSLNARKTWIVNKGYWSKRINRINIESILEWTNLCTVSNTYIVNLYYSANFRQNSHFASDAASSPQPFVPSADPGDSYVETDEQLFAATGWWDSGKQSAGCSDSGVAWGATGSALTTAPTAREGVLSAAGPLARTTCFCGPAVVAREEPEFPVATSSAYTEIRVPRT